MKRCRVGFADLRIFLGVGREGMEEKSRRGKVVGGFA